MDHCIVYTLVLHVRERQGMYLLMDTQYVHVAHQITQWFIPHGPNTFALHSMWLAINSNSKLGHVQCAICEAAISSISHKAISPTLTATCTGMHIAVPGDIDTHTQRVEPERGEGRVGEGEGEGGEGREGRGG